MANHEGRRFRKHEEKSYSSSKQAPTFEDLISGFQVVGPKPEVKVEEMSSDDLSDLYEEAKDGIERVLEGGESVPDDIYGGTSSSRGVYCYVHVDDENGKGALVKLHLAEVYGALLAVNSTEELKLFRENYVDGLHGAVSRLPYAGIMLEVLEAKFSA